MKKKSPHILIFGTGLVGGYIGGRLQAALSGEDEARVSFYGRASMGQNFQAHGLTLSHFKKPELTLPPERLNYITELEGAETPKAIFLCVKSQDTRAAAAQIKAQGWRCPIISWQNGVGNVARLKEILPGNEIIAGVVPYNITAPKAGHLHCGTGGALHIGQPKNPIILNIAEIMGRGGEPMTLRADIESDQWCKLIINLNNALNTLSGGTLLAGFAQRDYRKAWAASIDEGLQILAANNIKIGSFNGNDPKKFSKLLGLPNFLFKPIFQTKVKVDAAARSSMLDDLEAGKPSEIDFLQGAIIKLAKSSGQTAPVNQAIYDATQAAFKAGKSPKMSGAEIWDLVR